jgi:hypothetical protein
MNDLGLHKECVAVVFTLSEVSLPLCGTSLALLRDATDRGCLSILHSLLLIMHLLLHLHQTVVVLFELFVLRETNLIAYVLLDSHHVKRIYTGWEMAALQNTFVDWIR